MGGGENPLQLEMKRVKNIPKAVILSLISAFDGLIIQYAGGGVCQQDTLSPLQPG